MTDFQSAQALAAKALETFNTELRPVVPRNETSYIGNLEDVGELMIMLVWCKRVDDYGQRILC